MADWTEERLAHLEVRDGFRLRGAQITRLESLTDAAFGLALTFLVVVQQEIPRDYDDLLLAFRQIPVFAASFAVLILFWVAHVRWSRRYGIEDGRALVLSLLLVFTMLLFVFPLKIVFGSFFSYLSGGWVTRATRFHSEGQLRTLFIIFGTGFILMQLSLAGLYAEARRRAGALALNGLERFDTDSALHSHLISTGIAVLATILALLLPDTLASLSGYSYALFAAIKPTYWARVRRRRAAILAHRPEPEPADA